LVSYANSLDPEFLVARRRLIWVTWCITLLGVALFVTGLALNSPRLGAESIPLLITGPILTAGASGGLRGIRRATPTSIEIQEDRLVVHANPLFAGKEGPQMFEIAYKGVDRLVDGKRNWSLTIIPHIDYIGPLRSRWEITSTRGLPKGTRRVRLLLSHENLVRVKSAYRRWVAATSSSPTN
jgi:hypothetical protein